MTNRASLVFSLFAAACCASGVHAQSALPKIWTWDTIKGTPTTDPAFTRIVRLKIFTGSTGWTGAYTADQVCDTIVARGLKPGQVTLLFQDWGRGDGDPVGNASYYNSVALFHHELDALPSSATTWYWLTPWFTNGIAETKAWVAAFVAQYKARQAANPAIPDPSRIHMDTEISVTGCCSNLFIDAFHACLSDSRYATEGIPGFPDGSGGSLTLQQLYLAAGSPAYDRTQPIHVTTQNQNWFKWYASICSRAGSAAMDAALYQPMRDAFPGCKASDYQRVSSDGANDPVNPPFVARTIVDDWQAGAFWANFANESFEDLFAPNFYVVHEDHRVGSESYWDATMRVRRRNLESIAHSFALVNQPNLTSWVTLPGTTLGVGTTNYTQTAADTRRMLALLRAKGLDEIILWHNLDVASQWDSFHEQLKFVYGSRITGIRLTQCSGALTADQLETSHFNQAIITADSAPTPRKTDVTVSFDTNFNTAGSFEVNLESLSSSAGYAGTVYLRDISSGVWASIGTYTTATSSRSRTFTVSSPAPYIDATGRVFLRIIETGSGDGVPIKFQTKLDLVQLIRGS